MTNEEVQAAKDELHAAVRAYFAKVNPGVYVDDWALVVHKDSIELTADGQSIVSTLVPTGQPFHRTAGLLQLAAHSTMGGLS